MRAWLLSIRLNAKLSQFEVAKRAGISRAYYTNIESGKRGAPLNVNIAKKIAKVLNFEWTRFYEE